MAVMKIIKKAQILRRNLTRQLRKEILIMKQLKHSNVVQMQQVLANQTQLFVIVEYISRGDLLGELRKQGSCLSPTCVSSRMHVFAVFMCPFDCLQPGKLSEDEARRYFRQIIEGIQYIHSQGVYHCDLKVGTSMCSVCRKACSVCVCVCACVCMCICMCMYRFL